MHRSLRPLPLVTAVALGLGLLATETVGAATNAAITVSPPGALATSYSASGAGCAAPAVPSATMNNVQARDVFASLVNDAAPVLQPDGTWTAAMPGLATMSFYFLQSTCFNATTLTNEIFYRSDYFPVGATPSALIVEAIDLNTVKVSGSGCKTGSIEVRALGANGAPAGDAAGTPTENLWEATIELSTTPLHYFARCSGVLFAGVGGQIPPDETVPSTDPATSGPTTTQGSRGLPSTGAQSSLAPLALALMVLGLVLVSRTRRTT